MDINDISYAIRGAAFRVHHVLGPGLLESVYENALKYELEKEGFKVDRQIGIPLLYEGICIDVGFRLDLLVEQQVIVEIKSVDGLSGVHFKQVMTYLKLAEKQLGFLINFNVRRLEDKESLVRIISSYK